MPQYKTAEGYIEEVPQLQPQILSADTAIPAFMGYTQKAQHTLPDDLRLKPTKISSMLEYETCFGLPAPEKTIQLTVDTNQAVAMVRGKVARPSKYLMYYSLQMFFSNGGGPCYIISVGGYATREVIALSQLRKGLAAAGKCKEVTLLVFPDATGMPSAAHYYTLHREALQQAAAQKNRFVVMDIWKNPKDVAFNSIQAFRDFDFGDTNVVKYGAAYYPHLFTQRTYYYEPAGNSVVVRCKNNPRLNGTLAELKEKDGALFEMAAKTISQMPILLPAAAAVVGKYATVDQARGVWKAPANEALADVLKPEIMISQTEQDGLNVDPVTGKSINVIRSFTGIGAAVIWGARTMAGNSNEWRYIPVCRFFMMVEQSVKAATEEFVFAPNDLTTWVRVRGMIGEYLTMLWRKGALMGNKPDAAFFVKVGLNETMTDQDILDGRMIVEIGLAVVRPAEFIILRFTHKMKKDE